MRDTETTRSVALRDKQAPPATSSEVTTPDFPIVRPPTRYTLLLRRLLSYRGRSLEVTTAGWLFILISLAVGFAAINSGSNLLHVVFGCQMGMIVASGVLSEMIVRRAKVRRKIVGSTHVDVASLLEIEVENTGKRAPLMSVTVEDQATNKDLGTCSPISLLVIPSAQKRVARSRLTMVRRGWSSLPPAAVSTGFPFGMFIKRREVADSQRVLVYPRIRAMHVPIDEGDNSCDGESTGAQTRTGEFFGLDEFRDGMELRRIHWPATARIGRPVVREFESQGKSERWLDLSNGVTGDPDFEAEIESIASHAVALLRHNDIAVGLRHATKLVVPPARGSAQQQQLLEYLATAGATRS